MLMDLELPDDWMAKSTGILTFAMSGVRCHPPLENTGKHRIVENIKQI